MNVSIRSGLLKPRDFLYILSLYFIKARIWGEIRGLCLLGIVHVVRGATVSKVATVIAVARLIVDISSERGDVMSIGSIVKFSARVIAVYKI